MKEVDEDELAEYDPAELQQAFSLLEGGGDAEEVLAVFRMAWQRKGNGKGRGKQAATQSNSVGAARPQDMR